MVQQDPLDMDSLDMDVDDTLAATLAAVANANWATPSVAAAATAHAPSTTAAAAAAAIARSLTPPHDELDVDVDVDVTMASDDSMLQDQQNLEPTTLTASPDDGTKKKPARPRSPRKPKDRAAAPLKSVAPTEAAAAAKKAARTPPKKKAPKKDSSDREDELGDELDDDEDDMDLDDFQGKPKKVASRIPLFSSAYRTSSGNSLARRKSPPKARHHQARQRASSPRPTTRSSLRCLKPSASTSLLPLTPTSPNLQPPFRSSRRTLTPSNCSRTR